MQLHPWLRSTVIAKGCRSKSSVDERDTWLREHPKPHSPELRLEFYRLFPQRLQKRLDRGGGTSILARPDVRKIVANSINFFDGERYDPDTCVIMPNHVHVLVTPLADHRPADILHTWKSYSAHRINRLSKRKGPVWMKESYDHIVRNASSHERIREYIRKNPAGLREGTFTLMYTDGRAR